MISILLKKIETDFLKFALLFCISLPAYAEFPLDIEALLTDKGKFKLDLGMTYANINRSHVSAEAPFFLQVGPTQFIRIPTEVGEKQLNRDIFIPNIGLRYGLMANTEVYGRATWLIGQDRFYNEQGYSSNNQSHFESAWLGINHRFVDDKEFPAVLGFIEGALAEKQNSTSRYGKS